VTASFSNGRAHFDLGAGKRTTVSLRLRKRARHRLHRRHKLHATVRVTTIAPVGQRQETSKVVVAAKRPKPS
jgi:hypothetical protein